VFPALSGPDKPPDGGIELLRLVCRHQMARVLDNDKFGPVLWKSLEHLDSPLRRGYRIMRPGND
jgi:hypothetical protein